MQKRTLYISLLLVSCLLFFGLSSSFAQTVTFQSKTAYRCNQVILNVTVESQTPLSAFELVFEVTGDYSSMSVDFAGGLTDLDNRIGPVVDGNVVRMAALKGDAGDGCLDASGGMVVAEITLQTADVCTGTIDIVPATVEGGCCNAVSASTGLVGCDPIEALATTIVPGSVTIVNRAPSITCPDNQTVHWGDLVDLYVDFSDPDDCETLSFEVFEGPGDIDNNGHYTWQTGGDDVCDHLVKIRVTDKCGASDECSFNICVQNTPPEITANPDDTLFAVWCITLSDQVIASDDDGGPSPLLYTVASFDGPTWFGSGLQMNSATGEWTWDIGDDPVYLGDFTLCVIVSDGANICSPCSPENADTACYNIHVSGFAISIEKIHDQLQGHNTTVSIYLDSAYMPAEFCCDLIGGFDFLIAYDASALTAIDAAPGELIDNGKFEYFTYRFGPFGNCDGACPSGLMRIVGLRETNNGVINTYHITGPGELVKLNFLVTNDRTFECQFVPVRFFWLDCGDNTLSDESGDWLHMGLQVFDFEGNLITDPQVYGFNGPDPDCFDTVYASDQTFKNAPIGSIIFRNGGVDIICADSIDDRGDINMNGIANEIADAVLFTNYFIYGITVFPPETMEGQIAASDVNADGRTLTVADLVYLIRIIIGDALPLPKVAPSIEAKLTAYNGIISVDAEIAAAHFVLAGNASVALADGAAGMEIKTAFTGTHTNVLVYSFEKGRIASGAILQTDAHVVRMEAADYNGNTYKTVALPANFALKQNYPNPFNPVTAMDLELPVASHWNIAIYNVSGQRVAEFSGFSEAGTVTVEWDAQGLASGLYFYKAKAGAFEDTKKMMLLK